MRSWFDDHMTELAEHGLVADRGYDDVPAGYDVLARLRRIIDGSELPLRGRRSSARRVVRRSAQAKALASRGGAAHRRLLGDSDGPWSRRVS
jgi:hypothetical protein